MPYSWNRPPVPINKSKQGGRSFDSSTYTDFTKIGTIAQVNSTKTTGTNNKNLYSNLDEKRRAELLISGLQTIPRALCPTCPIAPITATSIINSATINALSGITFYVIYYGSVNAFNAKPYINNNIIYQNSSYTNVLQNINVVSGTSYGSYIVGGVTSLPAFSAGATRQDIVTSLTNILSTYTFNTDNKLVASVTPDGRLILTRTGTTPFQTGGNPPFFAGLFFGDGPSATGNGSTTLGATNLNGRCGVDGACLVITEGNTTITSPYVIGDPRINFSIPC